MKSRELQTQWWDWLGTSERLLRSLHEQTAALILRDVGRVERLQPEIDTLTQKLASIDEAAVTCVHQLAETLGTEPKLRSLAQVLEKAEAQQLHGLGNRVGVAARNVQAVIDKNRALLENEMTYVNGTLTLLARTAAVKERAYTGAGRPSNKAAVRVAVAVDTAA